MIYCKYFAARSTSHLAPTPEHHRSVSYEETTTASTSTDSVPGVRIRSESSQVSCDSPIPAPRTTYVAAYEYTAQKEDELDLPLGSIVKLVTAETQEDGWYRGELDGKIGLFPSNYARLLLPEAEKLIEFDTDDVRMPTVGDVPLTMEQCRIGHGATATVFKVELKIDKLVKRKKMDESKGPFTNAALKRFNKHTFNNRGEHMTEEQQLEQLKREANLVNGLSHPNIVSLLGICLADPYFGLMLELCEGSSLRTVCRSMLPDTAIPLAVLVDWAKQVAEGMEYLTKEGYVHRDLKADNVLVKEEVCLCLDEATMNFPYCSMCGKVPVNKLHMKITDFGVTRKMTADANRFSTAGTYAWLAPEAFRDGAWSESSDVWSYGVVLWELLSREDPYQGQIPATIAFQIVMRGQSLSIDANCPPKWKEIMQSCWELEPANRPKFSTIVQEWAVYSEELNNAPKELKDAHLQRAPSKMASDLYSHLQLTKKMFNDLYAHKPGINRSDRTSIAPETKARRVYKHGKPRKLDISSPIGPATHVVSVQKDKTNDNKFKINWNDENFNGGTLPRLSGRQSALSLSSPDLYQIHDILNGSNTVGPSIGNRISRKNAIRVKKPHNHDPHMISPNSDDANMFAKITSADEVDPSHSKEHKKGTLSRAWAKLGFKNTKRDSKEDHDDKAAAGSISSRSSSTTSSNRIIAGQATRGASAFPFLEAGARSRAQSAADCWGDDSNAAKKNKVSPTDKRPVKQTNLTERFVKDSDKDSVMRPGNLPNYHRKSALDQAIPASPNSPDSISNFAPMHISSRRTTANSSSDGGGATYEPLVVNSHSHSQGAGHGFRNPIIHPSLSDLIPITGEEQTHYEMGPGRYFDRNGHGNQNIYGHISTPTYVGIGHGRSNNHSTHYYPVGGGCDSYIPIAPKGVIKPTVGEVNNSPYSDNFRFLTRNVQNPQYIQCKQNQKPTVRTPAVPIKIQSESNLVTTGAIYSPRPQQLNGIGNGMSTMSLNEAPTIPAPPPPRISMSPPTDLAPVVPAHEASVSPDSRKIMDQEILKQPVVEGTEIF
ncbi:CBN-MLK-1 protein [Caenorhabditis brenneri]|uniref:CBN-MLK-1 protein n=1 Tax=Caenorhabditis brenneri TaxID=135651 RepID=G0MS69_CAEBE|nr:CBN-MLK-1 protein [Caenorhabditis brenneri]